VEWFCIVEHRQDRPDKPTPQLTERGTIEYISADRWASDLPAPSIIVLLTERPALQPVVTSTDRPENKGGLSN
jgi:hypothetical protein